MKDITTEIYLTAHLKDWLVHHYGDPVRFPRGCIENELLRRLTVRRPEGSRGSDHQDVGVPSGVRGGLEVVRIVLPDDALHRPEFFNYLGRRSRRRMAESIDSLFRLHLFFGCLHHVARPGMNRRLFEWCRENGIRVEARESVRQKFSRMRRDFEPYGVVLGEKYCH